MNQAFTKGKKAIYREKRAIIYIYVGNHQNEILGFLFSNDDLVWFTRYSIYYIENMLILFNKLIYFKKKI